MFENTDAMETRDSAVEELVGAIEAWRDEGLGTCPEIDKTNYPDAMADIIAWAEKVRATRG